MAKKIEYNPTKHLGYDIYELLENSRQSLSHYIHCDKDDIAFFPNPSTALNTVIKSLDINPGDEILSTNHEYGTLDRVWNLICKEKQATYIRQSLDLPLTSKEAFLQTFLKRLTDKTKIIFISHITSSTGLIFPVEEICRIAREKNIMCIIDGAHAPGHINLNISSLNPDIYTGACHKWMCSPKGTAFLYVKKELQNKMKPLVISWGYDSDMPSHSQFLDYMQWQGTNDLSSYLTIPNTIAFLEKHNWPKVAKECRKLNIWAREQINNLLNVKPIADEKFLGQMSSISIKSDDILQDQINFYLKYKIQIPFIKWNNRELIRISIQAYNTKEDVEKLLDALKNEYC
jgi:isopenicillin-N epimerase